MGIDICLEGKTRSRGTFARAAKPASMIDQVVEFANQYESQPLFCEAFAVETPDAVYTEVFLADSQVSLVIASTGRGKLQAETRTNTLGPGYHQAVCRFLQGLGGAIGVDWSADGDETGYFESGDRVALEKSMLAWLRMLVKAVATPETIASRDPSDGPLLIAMPMTHRFMCPGDLHTPLGPRSFEWLNHCLTDETTAISFFPWWDEQRTARVLLNLALLEMWFSIAWIPPESPPAHHVSAQVAEHLAHAYQKDESLDYPWHEWAEILDALENSDFEDPTADKKINSLVQERAQAERNNTPIGYRRWPMVLNPSMSGWNLPLGPNFEDGVDDDGNICINGVQREVVLSCHVGPSSSPRPTLQEMIERHEGETSEHMQWEHHGQTSLGFLTETAMDDGPSHALIGIAYLIDEDTILIAFITIVFSEDDKLWAVETFRALRHGLSLAEE